MKDYILRVTAGEGQIRAFFADMRETADTAAGIHRTTPVMTAALGRLMTAAAIMGLMLKDDSDLLTLQIRGKGKAQGLLATADAKGRVKGYPYNPDADAPKKATGKLNVSGVIGEGSLTVIKDMGAGEPYNGTVELVSGEIAEDIAYYFAQSEQTPSIVSLGVLVEVDYTVRRSGGFIVQLMPGAGEWLVDYLEEKVGALPSVTAFYEEGGSPEALAETLFADIGYETHEKVPVAFYCNCSRERVEKALISLGKEELADIAEKDDGASLKCQFCNKQYDFSKEDVSRLLEESRPDHPTGT
jgi:molecular chaperone Hsp33